MSKRRYYNKNTEGSIFFNVAVLFLCVIKLNKEKPQPILTVPDPLKSSF